jgi:anti-repressor protein
MEIHMGQNELFTSIKGVNTDLRNVPQVLMDSREIAELTNKRHADVIRDIESQLSKIGDERNFASVYKGGNGEERKNYLLPYRETMILISGYSVELRAKIVDRWMELESGIKIPKTMAEALRLAADQAQRIEDMTPAYEFGSYLIEASNKWLSMSEAAAILSAETGLGRNNLFAWLRGQKILMANNVPYREYIDRGYFNVTEKSTPVGPKTVTIVSNAGMAWILKQYKLSN